ncbi:MAG: cobalamin-dependent protein [Desulfobacterales bacterium]|nr:cobalamin-dependent protein [Desulfobacterales bacterium]MBF0398307.1 cobalamin-dependent protein [Desulfobacterales bacterium]
MNRISIFRDKLNQMIYKWKQIGIPERSHLFQHAKVLSDWKKDNDILSLWIRQPLMLTATLDDSWGHGLEVIHAFADILGLKKVFIGLLQSPEVIIERCKQHQPDILGLTVLQFDSEDELSIIAKNVPHKTKIIAGGSIFKADPELINRTGIHFAAKDVSDFLYYMLNTFDFVG